MQVSANQPVQYTPTSGTTGGSGNTPVSDPSVANSSSESGYPYSQDVFNGPYQNLKSVYSSFDSNVSRFSPFYGKMGGTPAQENPQPVTTAQQPTQTQPTTPTPAPQPQQPPPAPVIPAFTPPTGPAASDLQQKLQQEVSQITSPQKAIEVIAQHAMISRQERTMANDVAWGARFYAKKAEELAQNLSQNKPTMSQGQIQGQLRQIEAYQVKAISVLNEAKKKAINNYNEALSATLLYNHFFTQNGQFATVLSDNDRKFVTDELTKTWSRWSGGFQKEWQGQAANATESPTVIDNASREVAISLDNVQKLVATVQ